MLIPATVSVAAAALVSLGAIAVEPAAAQSGSLLSSNASRPAGSASSAKSAGAQSPWVKGHNSMARLVAGAEPTVEGGRRLVAGVEIRLADGWKTYWRHPGDDGGLPPTFEWSGSRNLKSARVLYPVPERIKSLNGTSLGYGKSVVFPVEIEPVDPAQSVLLTLALDYGICREICIPAEARLTLTLEPGLSAMPVDIATSLAKIPRVVEGATAAQVLRSAKAVLTGNAPALTFDIAVLAAGGKPDLFVEAPGGSWLPVPAKAGEATGGVQRFRIDLKGVEEATSLAGKRLRLTVSGTGSASELTWVVK